MRDGSESDKASSRGNIGDLTQVAARFPTYSALSVRKALFDRGLGSQHHACFHTTVGQCIERRACVEEISE